ncbi:unnamed protein product [Jaminaea pallidilutea]
MPAADSRFDTSSWKAKDLDAEGSGSSSQASGSGSEGSQHIPEDDLGEDSEEGVIDEEDEELIGEGAEDDEGNAIMAPLSQKELASFESKQRKRGIIYIGRIPPGMTPPKVRHLLSGFGEVERIYLQDGRKKAREAEEGSAGKNKKSSRRNTQFTEGWIEFASKSTAKVVAATLNAAPIGFSSGGRHANKNAKRWKDDVWTMKYLPGFKWHMLSEQMAHERAAHAARLRTELSQSKMEQQDYLKKVERARIQNAKEAKRQQRQAKSVSGTGTNGVDAQAPVGESRVRTFKQRQAILRDVRDQDKGGDRESVTSAAATSKKRSRSTADGEDHSQKSAKRPGSQAQRPAGDLNGVLSKIL